MDHEECEVFKLLISSPLSQKIVTSPHLVCSSPPSLSLWMIPFLPPLPLWGRFLGLAVVFLCELLLGGFLVLTAVEVGPSRPLQKSSVQMQAMISSFSTGLGTHCALGTMGRVTLMGETRENGYISAKSGRFDKCGWQRIKINSLTYLPRRIPVEKHSLMTAVSWSLFW